MSQPVPDSPLFISEEVRRFLASNWIENPKTPPLILFPVPPEHTTAALTLVSPDRVIIPLLSPPKSPQPHPELLSRITSNHHLPTVEQEVDMFVATTGASPDVARRCPTISENHTERAIQLFIDSPLPAVNELRLQHPG
jgi:hypothetical protein